jgi:DNA-binding response OmpR family regulator
MGPPWASVWLVRDRGIASATGAAGDGGGGLARIVVADDESDIRHLMAVVLRGAGHDVVEAPPGADLPSLLRRERPVVVVMDVGLGGVSGIEVALLLAADPETAGIGIIITSSLDAEIRGDARAIGIDFLAKPFTPDELRTRVARALAARPDDTRCGVHEGGAAER